MDENVAVPEAPAPVASPNSEFAQKLLEVERQRASEAAALQEERRQNSARMEAHDREIRELKEQLKPKVVDPQNPLASIDLQALHAAATDPESEPARRQIALDEILRRRDEKVKQDIRAEKQQLDERDRALAQTLEDMKERYGPEILDKKSALGKRANEHMIELQKRYGPDVMFDPKVQLFAASLARNDLLAEQVAKKQEVERERDEYKRRAGMERGNQPLRPSDQSKELWKKGKVKEAIQSMDLYSKLFRE